MNTAGTDVATAGSASVGTLLRDARERAGLSLDAVAQQLKLAPRQVRAIEEDDYARLPGRTFVRGFVRNYARIVRLDPDAVVGALPRGEATSPLERLTYTPGRGTIAEMPDEGARKPAWSKWLIPAALLAIVAVAAMYEYTRPTGGGRQGPAETVPGMAPAVPVPAPPSTALPNPLEAPATGEPTAAVPAPEAAPSASAALETGAGAPLAAPAPLVVTWRGPSWVEVRDATGALLVSQTGSAGSTQSVSGTPPIEVVIGNAANVAVAWRGQPVDLAPYTRQNVARFALR
jgi:cytoskeleton protein RodZ